MIIIFLLWMSTAFACIIYLNKTSQDLFFVFGKERKIILILLLTIFLPITLIFTIYNFIYIKNKKKSFTKEPKKVNIEKSQRGFMLSKFTKPTEIQK